MVGLGLSASSFYEVLAWCRCLQLLSSFPFYKKGFCCEPRIPGDIRSLRICLELRSYATPLASVQERYKLFLEPISQLEILKRGKGVELQTNINMLIPDYKTRQVLSERMSPGILGSQQKPFL